MSSTLTNNALEQYSVFADDPRIETEGGMKRYHAGRLLWFCQGVFKNKQLMVIVRGSNPNSLQFQGRENHFPKPGTVHSPTGSRGRQEIDGTKYYSDYDLMGVYELRDNGAYYRLYVSNTAHIKAKDPAERTAHEQSILANTPNLPLQDPFLCLLNTTVEPTAQTREACLFQHGSNDDYMLGGKMQNPKIGDVFLAFCPDGNLYLLPNKDALRQLYQHCRISFNY